MTLSYYSIPWMDHTILTEFEYWEWCFEVRGKSYKDQEEKATS